MIAPQKSEAPPGGGAAKVTYQSQLSILPHPAFPSRPAAACSEVLAHLLRGEAVTGMGAVFQCATTRLAAHVCYLRKELGWPIESTARAIVCSDGRSATIAVYHLPGCAIVNAFDAGAQEWLNRVDAARAAQRAKAHEAAQRAARMNVNRQCAMAAA